jgi:hypothetical protein
MPTEKFTSLPGKHHLFPLGVVGADPPYPLPAANTPVPGPLGLVGVSTPLLPVSLAAASFCRKLIHNSDILYHQHRTQPPQKTNTEGKICLGESLWGWGDLFSVARGSGDIM